MKKSFALWIAALCLLSCTRRQPIVILFENDVHCAVEGYAALAGLRDSFRLVSTPYVRVVSAGDWAQGGVIGSLTGGEAVVRILNSVGYEALTVGNHEFDYGVPQLMQNAESLDAAVLCCNIDGPQGPLFPSYRICSYGGTKVAYVGVATPTTYNTSTPTYFRDSLGRVVYDFHLTDTYQCIQQAVDEARAEGAEYVILLSHLGDDSEVCPSPDMIAHTRGIDAVLDGHAHHLFNTRIPNMDGDSVLFASTETKFRYVGILTISTSGEMQIELRPTSSITIRSKQVQEQVDKETEALAERTGRWVGYTVDTLYDRDREDNRIVRWQQTNMGLLLCDAWRHATGAQIGVMNGGGIRAGIPAGDITMGQVMNVLPFNNRIWLMEATGQQILDALEVGVMTYPVENGDFPQTAGLRYRIRPNVPSSVELDSNRIFVRVGNTRRVYDVEVEDAQGHWSAIRPDKNYTVAGQSYIMLNSGASGMYNSFQPIREFMLDVDAVVDYIHSMNDTIRYYAD